jgi:pimeloyl-ACP methyl ester carboxylesterase
VLVSTVWPVVAAVAGIGLLFMIYLGLKYSPIIVRIFQEMPVFQPMRAEPEPGGEDVRFRTEDGMELVGTYYTANRPQRLGVVAFCHEFLSDRHSVHHYADHLRDLGFDVFTFDFRNHGDSPAEPGYEPMQWVSDRDRWDLRAALDYLRSRPDRDEAGVGLFGVSRGGGAALCIAAEDPAVWGVVTDGAFPTRGTVLAFILRWAEIYLPATWLRKIIPMFMYRYVAKLALIRSERRLGRRFLDLEKAVARKGPRPWLAIHGEKDNYISPAIARGMFDRADEPKQLWIVPKAKHNRCREVEPEAYRRRVAEFFVAHAPRRLAPGPPASDEAVPESEPQALPLAAALAVVEAPAARATG